MSSIGRMIGSVRSARKLVTLFPNMTQCLLSDMIATIYKVLCGSQYAVLCFIPVLF